MLSRQQSRSKLDELTRIHLAEGDLDQFEQSSADQRRELLEAVANLRREAEARFDKQDARQARIYAVCISILSGLVVSSVMLVVTLVQG